MQKIVSIYLLDVTLRNSNAWRSLVKKSPFFFSFLLFCLSFSSLLFFLLSISSFFSITFPFLSFLLPSLPSFYFQTGSHYITLVGLRLPMWTRLLWNSQRFNAFVSWVLGSEVCGTMPSSCSFEIESTLYVTWDPHVLSASTAPVLGF